MQKGRQNEKKSAIIWREKIKKERNPGRGRNEEEIYIFMKD